MKKGLCARIDPAASCPQTNRYMAITPKEGRESGRVGNGTVFAPHRAFLLLLAAMSAWAIAVCAPFWYTDPNYTYGWIVPPLVAVFLWRRIGTQPTTFWESFRSEPAKARSINRWLLALPLLALFPIEVLRTEYHQSGVVLWGINLAAVGLNLAAMWWIGGKRLLAVVGFPVAFFLTAVPWPAFVAHPIQQNLMIAVANGVTEVLLWMGVPVSLSGAVLTLSKGTVGIVEACSGLRSLQSGIMVSMAVAELFMLSTRRRWILVGGGVFLALADNFIRTFVLCMIVEKSGETGLHKAHDTVGLIAMYTLYILIWVGGKILARGSTAGDVWPGKRAPGQPWAISGLNWKALPDARPALAVGLTAFAIVHVWYLVLETKAHPQTTPYFTAKYGSGTPVGKIEFNEEVWNQLGANSGEQLRCTNSLASFGFVDAYHLFWKPSPMSKVALHHRPDICMPGTGWKQVGEVTPIKIVLDGQTLDFHLFRFERSKVRAFQLWGVWRNGQTVPMDFGAKLTALPEKYGFLPTNRHMMGVELVSCFLPYLPEQEPSIELLKSSLQTAFTYRAPKAQVQQ